MIQLIKQKQQRLENPYAVKTSKKVVKDFDINKRIVTGLFNSYFYIDSDLDMLVTGAAADSILAKGAGSTAGNKIKHLKDHKWDKVIARIDVLEETEVEFEGKRIEGIYFESYYPETQDSTDMLIKIQEGLYDDRSIGFRYVTLGVAEKESEHEDRRKRWEEFYPLALNPEKADEFGFFWVIKEIDLFEGSDVAFGANKLTPMLGVKGQENELLNDLMRRVDAISGFVKSGASDESIQQSEMEILQLKSYIAYLTNGSADLKKLTEMPKKRINLIV